MGKPSHLRLVGEAPSSDGDPVQKLEKLSALHKQGVLTDAEFQSAKAKVLGEL